MNFTSKATLLVLSYLLSTLCQAQVTSGLWTTNCNNGLINEQTYSANNRVISTESFHSDQNCQKISFRFQTTGLVSYYKGSDKFIDFIYGEIFLTLFKQEFISDFNQRKVCGLSDWTLSQAQNITGLKCAIFNISKEAQIPPAGEIKYGIFQMNQGKLYYGQLSKEFNSSTPAVRPTQINFFTEYIFQNSL